MLVMVKLVVKAQFLLAAQCAERDSDFHLTILNNQKQQFKMN